MRSLLWMSAAVLLTSTSSYAGIVYSFPFNVDTSPSQVGTNVQSVIFDDANLNGNFFTCVCDDGFGPVYQAYPTAGSTSAALALANSSFFTITVTMNPGFFLNPETLTYDVGKGGAADPRGYIIRSSVDGFSSDLVSVLLPAGGQQAPASGSVDLSAAQFQGLSVLSLRFYVFTPDPSVNSVDWANVTLNTPEPGTLLLMGLAVALIVTVRLSGGGRPSRLIPLELRPALSLCRAYAPPSSRR